MQSRWLDLPCESRLEGLMLVELPVVQPETLRYSGSLVFSWFFWIGRLAVRTTRKAGFCRGAKGEDTRWVLRGKKEGRGAQTASGSSFNYAIGAGSQGTRCAKKRPCAQRRSSLTSDSGKPGMTGANSMARSTRPVRSPARIRSRHASHAAQSASLALAIVP